MRSVALFTLVGLLFGCGATDGPSSTEPPATGGAFSGGTGGVDSSSGGAGAISNSGGSIAGSTGGNAAGGAATVGTGGSAVTRCDWVPLCSTVSDSCTVVFTSNCGTAQYGTFSCGGYSGWTFDNGKSFECTGTGAEIQCALALNGAQAYCSELNGTGGTGGSTGGTGGTSTGGSSGGSGGSGGTCTKECADSSYCTGLKTRLYCESYGAGCTRWANQTCLTACDGNGGYAQCI